jgi:nitrate reductase NapD
LTDIKASVFCAVTVKRAVNSYGDALLDLIESRILNISSAIVYAKSDQSLALRRRLSEVVGVEVHAATEDGKLVVTIESENDRSAVDTYEAIERMEGVLSVAMIFQQTEFHPEQEL